ncbi:menaquinone biosynthetic enzyme MqnA/MqnD family protein [Archaeoglobus veneficus]|uniref:Chorismate dehydratase n=1 Tax=Archaeoglobus veneficus (strain DSM 11195 / SNP6) TaxID=693661 RepID=F2KNJ2_ARCVS|nr:menaquinone biosynthesis protein [Archaeoglobus veneficus]AEA46220.1 protein of unknown function DUF178 [Archaeoglobus veneficus SNP6]
MPFRIGKFGLINNFLPYYWLEKSFKENRNFEIVEASPKQMASMLASGLIDYAPVPSFFFLQNSEKLRSYNFCIASRDKVLSVVVVSKMKELDESPIAVTADTMTSVNLLRIILGEKGLKNRLVFTDSGKASDLLEICKHALVIGDEAIKARMIYRVVMDLGEEWYELTGLPMVFGISSSLQEVDANSVDAMLFKSIDWGLKNMEEVVSEAATKFSMPPEFLEEYFKTLSYRMGNAERRGLKTFEEMCRESGIVRVRQEEP